MPGDAPPSMSGADEVSSHEHCFKPSPSRTTLTFARSGRIPDVTNE